MATRHPPTLSAMVSVLAIPACAAGDPPPADPAAVQLAAATDIVASIVANPGSIVVICVGYAGDWEQPALPAIDVPTLALERPDGCVERDGRLVSAGSGAQAISVRVGAPEPRGGLRAEVSVLTSTGSIDLAAYMCTVRRREGAWRSEGCELEAIS